MSASRDRDVDNFSRRDVGMSRDRDHNPGISHLHGRDCVCPSTRFVNVEFISCGGAKCGFHKYPKNDKTQLQHV